MNEGLSYECCRRQDRTKAKQQVTTASRWLTRAVDRGVDIDILTVLMVELEKVFHDFYIIDKEYEILISDEEHTEHWIVNGFDLTAWVSCIQGLEMPLYRQKQLRKQMLLNLI